jgi:hypothetical protein
MDLEALLIDLESRTDIEAAAFARKVYAEIFLTRRQFGVHPTHDAQDVVFHADRFNHAFFTDPSHGRFSFAKTHLARDRIERMRWILPVILGAVPRSACWRTTGESGRAMRLYLLHDINYVVWLSERRDGDGFNFSSAYVVEPRDIREYTRGGRKLAAF